MSAPNTPKQPDPVLTHSLSVPLAIAALLLMASTLWAMYDEFFGKRPWAEYQAEYVKTYSKYLEAIQGDRQDALSKIEARDDYKALKTEQDAEAKKVEPEIARLKKELDEEIQPRIDDLTKGMIDPRSQITAMIYLIETAPTEEKKAARTADLNKLYDMDIEVVIHDLKGEVAKKEHFKYKELGAALDELKTRKNKNSKDSATVNAHVVELGVQMKHIEEMYRTGLTPTEITSIRASLGSFRTEIKQIHVKDVDLVDRCESCHLGIRQPVPGMTAEALKTMTGASDKYAAAFAAHPKDRADLLKIHDPERFGCSPCHGGNGVGTTTIEKAHGKNEHWLWPMYDKANTEAGCVQCHQTEIRLEGGHTINAGRELFRHMGCWGCHPREGFRTPQESLQTVSQSLKNLTTKREGLNVAIARNKATATDDAAAPEAKRAANQENEQIALQLSTLTAEEQALVKEQAGYVKENKKVGPNLKNVQAKLNPDWIPMWLEANKTFRPNTRMPQFRFSSERQKQSIAAFIWQSGWTEKAPKMAAGDVDKGKDLFIARGCLACHTATIEGTLLGGGFAADLSREGEKANYDYLVHWVSHPDRRLVPYNRAAGRDCTPEEAKALPETDAGWEQAVIMPNLRLTDEDAQNIASFLMSMKKADAPALPAATYINDNKLFEEGKKWVKHFGCAGCHEIRGLENENSIGTDLTQEGSKPIDRLDFGLLTHEAEMGESFPNDPCAAEFQKDAAGKEIPAPWATHKGYFTRKLLKPEIFDQGKFKADDELLKMPNFNLNPEEVTQLTTFLLGSVDSNLPPRFYNQPKGYAKDIADGWWVVQKYNCIGCHQIMPGEKPAIQKLPQFDVSQGGDISQAPPNLVGEGARVNPEWLARFLRNPALSTENLHRNGVRPYLAIRMPTFSMSENEIQKLVRFFNALSKQPQPYIRPQYKPLTDSERITGRASVKAVCALCHASGDMAVYPASVKAPNLGFAGDRLKPEWIERWVVSPKTIIPDTSMPVGLFTYNDAQHRWIVTNQDTPGMAAYAGDQRELIIRYLLELNPEEAKALNAGP